MSQKVRGHYAYYGITGNARALYGFLCAVHRAWQKWLNRRNSRSEMNWERFNRLLKRYPIRCLDGIANRCSGQLYKGERTHIGWTAREIVLPTIPGSRASGAIIKVAGITGRIRGMKFKRADGQSVRPSLVVLDDPQTDESARSISQCAARESILAGAVLGLAGPGRRSLASCLAR